MDCHPQAIEEARPVLERTAGAKGTIAYSELVPHILVVPLEPNSDTLAQLLDEISRTSDAEGKGMLSAVVVHKTDDYLPGKGFFKLAARLGRDPSDKAIFYSEELLRVHAAYAR
jgi:hypothetical protein